MDGVTSLLPRAVPGKRRRFLSARWTKKRLPRRDHRLETIRTCSKSDGRCGAGVGMLVVRANETLPTWLIDADVDECWGRNIYRVRGRPCPAMSAGAHA